MTILRRFYLVIPKHWWRHCLLHSRVAWTFAWPHRAWPDNSRVSCDRRHWRHDAGVSLEGLWWSECGRVRLEPAGTIFLTWHRFWRPTMYLVFGVFFNYVDNRPPWTLCIFCHVTAVYSVFSFSSLTLRGRVTQICVFNTRLFSLHSTLNYAIHRACIRMILLDGCL